MDRAKKIQIKFKKILKRLKGLGIIKTFKLDINFCPIDQNLIKCLVEIDSVLKKCLKKIIKPRRAEIRNVITELVRKKNLNHLVIGKEEVGEKNVCFTICTKNDMTGGPHTFSCGFCDKIFNSKKSFVAHKNLHVKSKTYLCDKCGEVLYSRRKWQEHKNNHNEEARLSFALKLFENEKNNKQCNSEFLNPQNVHNKSVISQLTSTTKESKASVLNIDMENNVSKSTEEERFTCTCGKVFRIWKSFKKHEKLKHSFMNNKHTCQDCGKSFLERGKLNRHMLSHKDSKYCCSFCSKHFARSDTLKRHLSTCHSISKDFCCSFCQKKFNLKYNRDIHEEHIHKNINLSIHCEHCGRKFRNKIAFKSHLKTHLKSRITCTFCSKSFARKSYYENHVKSKHFSQEKSSVSNSV